VTLLPSGKVLVAGGFQGNSETIASAELCDPTSGTWTSTGSLVTGRVYHTATLLANVPAQFPFDSRVTLVV
jgi:hypothetical protein